MKNHIYKSTTSTCNTSKRRCHSIWGTLVKIHLQNQDFQESSPIAKWSTKTFCEWCSSSLGRAVCHSTTASSLENYIKVQHWPCIKYASKRSYELWWSWVHRSAIAESTRFVALAQHPISPNYSPQYEEQHVHPRQLCGFASLIHSTPVPIQESPPPSLNSHPPSIIILRSETTNAPPAPMESWIAIHQPSFFGPHSTIHSSPCP